jgi:hypothetical protein
MQVENELMAYKMKDNAVENMNLANRYKDLNECIPTIIVEANKDTLQAGEEFRAKVYLSDSTIFYYTEPPGSLERLIPLFRVNGKLVEVDSYFLIYTEEAKRKNGNLGEVSFGIIVPSPNYGDLEFGVRYNYVVN